MTDQGYTRDELRTVAESELGLECRCLQYEAIPVEDWVGSHIQLLTDVWFDKEDICGGCKWPESLCTCARQD